MKDLKIQIKIEDNDNLKEAHDLLLKLGFSTYSKESFDVWINQPKPIWLKTNCFDEQPNKIDWCFKESHGECKEITLPELRDLVVLKRNDVGDATHTDGRYSFYVGKDKNYFFSSCDKAWRGTWKNVEILKPIEKPMKEYLRKNNDGEYILEVTKEREAQEPHAKHWIEVPKGCDYLISVFGVNSFIDSDMFAKVKPKNVLWSRKPMKEYLDPENGYKLNLTDRPFFDWIEIPEGANFAWKSDGKYVFFTALERGYRDASVVWSRHTIPEELPFIDDEPKLDTQMACMEREFERDQCMENARREGLLGDPRIGAPLNTYDEPSVDTYKSEFGIEPPISLNDQYAEIEKVRQTLKTRQDQYGSFEDVAMITEQMVDIMRKGYYENLAYNQKMALYMICSKMARIVNGNPNHKDSWHDIAGYATLIDNELVSEKDMPF